MSTDHPGSQNLNTQKFDTSDMNDPTHPAFSPEVYLAIEDYGELSVKICDEYARHAKEKEGARPPELNHTELNGARGTRVRIQRGRKVARTPAGDQLISTH